MGRHSRNDFRDAGGLEAQSVQDLEGHAAYRAEETTRRTQGCLKIAEEMRDTASNTPVTVHQQVRRTHTMAVHIDQDLSSPGYEHILSADTLFQSNNKLPIILPSFKVPLARAHKLQLP
jgi:hypothetical protein